MIWCRCSTSLPHLPEAQFLQESIQQGLHSKDLYRQLRTHKNHSHNFAGMLGPPFSDLLVGRGQAVLPVSKMVPSFWYSAINAIKNLQLLRDRAMTGVVWLKQLDSRSTAGATRPKSLEVFPRTHFHARGVGPH